MARVLILPEEGVDTAELEAQLARAGYEVVCSPQVPEEESDFAMVLANTPGGLPLAGDLRRHWPEMPVVLVSVSPRDCALEAIELHAVACVPNPVPEPLLASACECALAERDRFRQLRDYRLLVERQSDLVVCFGPDCRLRYASPSYCRAFGADEADLLGKSFTSLIHPEDTQNTQQTLAGLAAPPHVSRHRERAHTTTGWRWFEWSARGVTDTAGKVVEIVSVGRDITEQVETEERASQVQQDLQRAQELAGLGMWSYDAATRRVVWSASMYSLLGLEPDDKPPSYTRLRPLVHRDDWARFDAAMGRAMKGEIGYRLDLRITRPDGQHRRLTASCEPERRNDGSVIRLIGCLQDVTVAEQARRRIETLAQFPAQNPYPVLRIDADGLILFANDASAELLADWHSAEGSPLPAELRQVAMRALATGTLQRAETTCCGTLAFTFAFAPVCDENFVNLYGMDISDLREAQDQATRLRVFYQTILENVHDGIWVTDSEDRLMFLNAAMERLAGVPRDAVLGRGVLDVFSPATMERLAPHYQRAKTSLLPVEYEIQAPLPTGREMHQSGWLVPRLRAGFFDGMICTVQDITERVLAASELRLKSDALENAINGFEIVGDDGTFLYVNPAHLRMWGYDRLEDVLGTSPASHCVDPGVPERIAQELRDVGQATLEFTACRRDGSTFEVLMAAHLHHDAEGRELYLSSSLDVSERKRAEELTARQQEELEQAVRERTADLRTMVNSMAGREVRMAELKGSVRALRQQLVDLGVRPAVGDPLGEN